MLSSQDPASARSQPVQAAAPDTPAAKSSSQPVSPAVQQKAAGAQPTAVPPGQRQDLQPAADSFPAQKHSPQPAAAPPAAQQDGPRDTASPTVLGSSAAQASPNLQLATPKTAQLASIPQPQAAVQQAQPTNPPQREPLASDEIVCQLQASFARLRDNLSHNRAVFTQRTEQLMGRIHEMEATVQKAMAVLEESGSPADADVVMKRGD